MSVGFAPAPLFAEKCGKGQRQGFKQKEGVLLGPLLSITKSAREYCMIHHPRSPTPWPALKRGLAGPSDAEAQRRLVEFGNEVEEVAHEALLLMFREVRRFVPSPPYDFLRLTPVLLVLRSSRCLLRILVD